MKEEIRRIMQMVKDGKISPEDAADLIEAFQDHAEPEAASAAAAQPEGAREGRSEAGGEARTEATGEAHGEASSEPAGSSTSKDPLGGLLGAMEKLGRDIATKVDWKSVATTVKTEASKGADALKKAVEEASKGKTPFAGIFGSDESRRVELPLSIPEGKVLRLNDVHGRVTVEGGHVVGSLTVEATFRAYNEEEAKAMAARYVPSLTESDDAVVFAAPEQYGTTTDLTVKVPKGTIVFIKIAQGDVEVRDTEAGLTVEGTSGHVRVKRVKGLLDLRTLSGDIKLENATDANATIETKSGDVLVSESDGSFNVRTSSGDVLLYSCSVKTAGIEAAAGNVRLDLTRPVTGHLSARTVSGDLNLDLPDGSDARVSLRTLRGNVQCGFELQEESRDRLTVTGRLGSGQGSIDLSAVNGDVSANLRDASVAGSDA